MMLTRTLLFRVRRLVLISVRSVFVTVVLFIAILFSFSVQGDVTNNSNHPIYVKPEDGTTPIRVDPGATFKGAHDGIAVPSQRPGKVYKIVNNVDATVNSNGDVEYSPNSIIGEVDQPIRGGWKDSSWLDSLRKSGDFGWNEIFKEANRVQNKPEASKRADRATRERKTSERERHEDRSHGMSVGPKSWFPPEGSGMSNVNGTRTMVS